MASPFLMILEVGLRKKNISWGTWFPSSLACSLHPQGE